MRCVGGPQNLPAPAKLSKAGTLSAYSSGLAAHLQLPPPVIARNPWYAQNRHTSICYLLQAHESCTTFRNRSDCCLPAYPHDDLLRKWQKLQESRNSTRLGQHQQPLCSTFERIYDSLTGSLVVQSDIVCAGEDCPFSAKPRTYGFQTTTPGKQACCVQGMSTRSG